MPERQSSSQIVEAIDFFCGAGGLSYGLKEAGVEIVAGLDIDPACRVPFTRNVCGSFFNSDLAETATDLLEAEFSEASYKLLAGCAPCQPFSTLSNGSKRDKSTKWPLLRAFTQKVRELEPDFVTMENVPVLRTQSIFDEFLAELESLGFCVDYRTLNAAEYGVPQRRKRLVLLASRHGKIRILSPQELGLEQQTVRDSIQHLAPVEAGQSDPTDRLHKARSLTPINHQRMQASRPGGTWHDWPYELQLDCHKKPSGSTFRSVYGRLEWDKPSGTMTTQSYNFGTGRFGHPEQDRSLTLREMAIIQSFPDDYVFVEDDQKVEFASIGRLIGNAVPVKLGYAIGRSLLAHVDSLTAEANDK